MNRVVVLGCGPAGLLAAHAASLNGADVRIYSIKQPSVISGAQFLHEHIPGLTGKPDGDILISKVGSRDGYARKVYGSSDIPVSWDTIDYTSRPAWSMKKSYDILWDMYGKEIIHYQIMSARDMNWLDELGADLYISSLPAPQMCRNNEHWFESVPMYIHQNIHADIPINTIIYNGISSVSWHRASNLFGHTSFEYGKDPGAPALTGFKPTAHNCDCHPHWMRVGRFGRWQRGVLVHHAFKQVMDAMQQMQ